MNELIRLAIALLAGGAQEPEVPAVRRFVLESVVNVIAGICAAAAAACWLVALWIVMLPVVGPAAAPLIIGTLLAAVSAVAFVAKRQRLGKPAAQAQPSPAPEQLLAEANCLYKGNRMPVLAAALVAGFIAARSST